MEGFASGWGWGFGGGLVGRVVVVRCAVLSASGMVACMQPHLHESIHCGAYPSSLVGSERSVEP